MISMILSKTEVVDQLHTSHQYGKVSIYFRFNSSEVHFDSTALHCRLGRLDSEASIVTTWWCQTADTLAQHGSNLPD